MVSKISSRLSQGMRLLLKQFTKFGMIGLLGFFVDIGLNNFLMFYDTAGSGQGMLFHKPLTAKGISVLVAMLVTFLGNKLWTFKKAGRVVWSGQEFLRYAVVSLLGMAVNLLVLGFSYYVLQFTSPLAYNIASNVIGLGLATLFRFWAYRRFVF